MFFTSTPIIAIAIFDQDVSAAKVLEMPELYSDGSNGAYHSTKIFWMWMCEAFVHSLIVLFLPLGAYGMSEYIGDGKSAGLYDFGLAVFFSVIVVVTLRLTFELKMVTPVSAFFMIISIIVFMFFWYTFSNGMFVYSAIRSNFGDLAWNFFVLVGNPTFSFTMIGSIVMCAGTTLCKDSYLSYFKPHPSMIAREQENKGLPSSSKIAPAGSVNVAAP